MGAHLAKLIPDLDIVSDVGIQDVEQGGDSSESSSWDSDESSLEELDEMATSETRTDAMLREPYFVEKRFIAGSNSFEYNIVKRK